jgi:hypothetical protein
MLSGYPCFEREIKDEQLFYKELLLKSFLNYPADVKNSITNNSDIQNWLNLPSFE